MALRIGMIGGGSWGTGLAIQLAKKHRISVWEFDSGLVSRVNASRMNDKFLPGVKIPEGVSFSSNLQDVVAGNDILIFAVPSQYLRGVLGSMSAADLSGKHLISLIKGVEDGTYLRMTEIIAAVLPSYASLSALSGPSHAEEVARNVPTAVILANPNPESIRHLQSELSTDTFRLYLNQDILGVELGGAVKNVIAIAAGICDGLGFGSNTKAALVTRGMEEMRRLSSAMGGDDRTLSGLSGIGDLITTCFSKFSRNRHVGEEIGKGGKINDITSSMVMVAEGVNSTKSIFHLGSSRGVSLPITESVYRIIFGGAEPATEVVNLMTRPFKEEFS